MADDRHYVPGDYYRICERTGFKVRANRTKKEWTNRYVRDISFEMRQPQDFVTGVRDDQTVFEPRPRSTDSFQGPLGTTLSANAVPSNAAPFLLNFTSTVRMFIGDTVSVMLDNGEMFKVILVDVPSQTSVQTDRPLPSKASSGNVVIDISAVSDPILYLPNLGNG